MCLKKLFDGKGNEHNLVSEKIGDLEKLSTDAKDNLVAAVNEVDGRIPDVSVEEWVFTMDDDSTATKKVLVVEE